MRTAINIKILIFILLLLFCQGSIFSQNTQPRIKPYTLEDGLSKTNIFALLKDSSGFIWIGTSDGLNRFDGQKFRHFKPNAEDTTAISGNYINKLLEDNHGNIWIGTLDGLDVYHPETEVFYKISLNTEKNESVTSLEIEENGTIWAGTRNTGIHRLLPLGQNEFEKDNFLSTTTITSLFIDSQKQLWIGGFDGAVFKFDLTKKSTEPKPLHLNIQGRVQAFYTTETKLLIGSEVGFYIYDINTKNVKRVNLNEQNQGLTKHVTEFLEAGRSAVWVGTGSGIFLFDWENEKVLNKIEYNENDIKGLSNNRVFSLLQLTKDQLFVGTNSNLDLLDFSSPYFKNISKNKRGEHVLNANSTPTILIDDQYTWVGTSVGGLNLIINNKTYYFKEDQTNPHSITGNNVREIVKDSKNQRLWIATSRGLNMIDLTTFDPDHPIFKTFTYDPKNTNSISNDLLKSITLDFENNLWGATFGQGIFRLELSSDNKTSILRFKNDKNDPNSLFNDFVEKIIADSANTIWAGTQGGLSRLRFVDNSLKKPVFTNTTVLENSRNSAAPRPSIVLDISIDSKGNKWLASTYGLNLYLGNNKFKTWTVQQMNFDGLIFSIQHDDNDNLWMGTSAGIIGFNPITEAFKTYGIEDGIQSNDFILHAKFKDKTGTIYLGGKGGLTYFHPKDLETIDHPVPLYFSQLRVKDEIVMPNNASRPWLTSAIYKTKNLQFKNDEFPFFLQFSSIDYRINKNVEFGYKLLPNDSEWNLLKEPEIQFLNLPAGDHTLIVNGFSRGKEWDQEPMRMNLTILPPWWATWWAYVFYLAIVTALGYFLYRFKLSRKLAVAESTRLKEVSKLKSGLYTNITHEFRTPLTVILGMTQKLKKNLKSSISVSDENSLCMIQRNGESLLEMVNEMLDLAKIESGSLELNLVQIDVIPFVKYISESFHSLAETKKISLTIYSEVDTLEMDIDVNKVASIFSNLLSNAIKFTSATGKVIVHLNKIELEETDFLIIKVQDNGIGLAKEDIVHLFDKFYQVNSTSTKQVGTGIGLSLTREFVKLMKGTISVESTLGKGSTFTVQIPITNTSTKTEQATITVAPSIKALAPVLEKEPLYEEYAPELPLVLIIEDNLDVAHYLKTCLQSNYQTTHANDGIIGIEMAYEKIPDIIISDVMMPGKDGFEVCATLKADERTDHIPIILLTAKVTPQDRLTGLTHGADAYLAKPFDQEELFTRLDQLILVRKKLIRKLEKNGLSSFLKEKVENPQTKFLKQVIESIHTHLDDTNFGPTRLAKEIGLSESQIYRKLKSITDKSTALFIRSVRLQKAKVLIETTDKTISEIAYQVGFNDPSWFSRAFKKEFNLAPSDIHK